VVVQVKEMVLLELLVVLVVAELHDNLQALQVHQGKEILVARDGQMTLLMEKAAVAEVKTLLVAPEMIRKAQPTLLLVLVEAVFLGV
jgi:hypothetical protein